MLSDEGLCTDDGLELPEVGPWAITKHKKIKYYIQLFATSMKNKWKTRVYIDLFSCAGKAKIKENNEIIPGSPLIAADINDQFDKYIFCEKKPEYYTSLKTRVYKYFPGLNCSYINDDCNRRVQEIVNEVPRFDRDNNGLSLCFIDPYKTDQLKFNTIQTIANSIYVDFLILVPSYMDINRNAHNYTRENDTTIDELLGTDKWRASWNKQSKIYDSFGLFVADYFCTRMKNLGYIYESLSDMELIRMEIGKNLPLYHICFFSRNKLGYKFWKETKKNTTPQIDFCFDED